MKKLLTLFFAGSLLAFQAPFIEAQTRPGAPSGPGGMTQSFFNDAFSNIENAFDDSEYTPEDAYYLGRAVSANILASYRPYTQNADLTRYLNRICQTIVINSPEPVAFNGYHVIILDSPEFNAFASPGGHIFLTRGLVELTTSEDMLAALIAHELSHIILRHGINIIEEMRFSNDMAESARRGGELTGNSAAARRALQYRQSVASLVDAMIKNGYSQSQEYEADSIAVSLLALSGYNPGSLREVLQLLQRVQASQSGGFNTTHPSPADRIAHAEPAINRYRVQDTRSYRVPRFINK